MEQINLDEGYYFGIGAFETLAIEGGHPIMLERHLQRLIKTVKDLGISNREFEVKVQESLIMEYLQVNPKQHGCLKIAVSDKNIIFSIRDNTYTSQDYSRGFIVELSVVLRNETSLLTYYKTLNYGDNIIEKRAVQKKGIDEPVFLNTKGQLTEGASTNIFFVQDRQIITPRLQCGLLNGIMRTYIMERYPVSEDIILLQDVEKFDEMFLTNSLLGIMPVKRFGGKIFSSRSRGEELLEEYKSFIL